MAGKRNKQNRYWSKEEKLRIVQRVVYDNLSYTQVANEEHIARGMLVNWVLKYLKEGESALENKRKPGNPLVKYSRRKELNELEKLEYENMKLRIENERLKKGYMMKGDGTYVMYKK